MARAEGLGNIAIILRSLIGVFDHQLDGRTGCLAFEHARQDLHGIGLVALCHVLVLTGTAFIEPVLQHRLGHLYARRAAVNRRSQCRTVAFTPGGDAKKMSKRVQAHQKAPSAPV